MRFQSLNTQPFILYLTRIYKTIDDLPPEVVRLIFTFLGSGHFRFIGGTSRFFRELYLSTIVGSESTTTIENVVSSVSCVELYLQEAGTDVPRLRDILNAAASYGRLDILEWAHQRGYSHACSKATSACAAKQGQLRALIWLHDHGCELSSEVCDNAAKHGHLNILQWARANECKWDEDMCAYAAEGGNLNILQWARANGCPWNCPLSTSDPAYVLLSVDPGGRRIVIKTPYPNDTSRSSLYTMSNHYDNTHMH